MGGLPFFHNPRLRPRPRPRRRPRLRLRRRPRTAHASAPANPYACAHAPPTPPPLTIPLLKFEVKLEGDSFVLRAETRSGKIIQRRFLESEGRLYREIERIIRTEAERQYDEVSRPRGEPVERRL